MNKKLIKMIASITCGLGIVGTIPFTTTSCDNSSSDNLKSLEVREYVKTIYASFVSETDMTPSEDLSDFVYTNNGDKVDSSDVQFFLSIDESKLYGLKFDQNTGVISGQPKVPASQVDDIKIENVFITVKSTVSDRTLSGKTNSFNIYIFNNNPTSLDIDEDIPSDINVYQSIYKDSLTPDLRNHVYTDTNIPITHSVKFSCDNLPEGLTCDPMTGVISGKCDEVTTISNLKIKAEFDFLDFKLVGYTNEFNVNVNKHITSIEIDGYECPNIHIVVNQQISPTQSLIPYIYAVYSNGEKKLAKDVYPNLKFSLVPDFLPSGLVFDSSTGVISGTPLQIWSYNNKISFKILNEFGAEISGSTNVFTIYSDF